MKTEKIRNIVLIALLIFLLGDKVVVTVRGEAHPVRAAITGSSLAPQAMVVQNGGSSGYVSIPAAAFQPMSCDNYRYINSGAQLWPEDMNSTLFYAPVQLPHGATITKVTFFWRDTSTYNGYVALERSNLYNGTGEVLATVYTADANAGVYSTSETNIINPVVDDAHHSYYMSLGLFWNSSTEYIAAVTVIIEYSYLAYLPLSMR
jgi:hypothetical protein